MKSIALNSEQALLITDRLTRKYLSGIDVAEGSIFYAAGKAYYLTDARYFSAAKIKSSAAGFISVPYKGEESVKQLYAESGAKSLLVDFTRITAAQYFSYESWAKNVSDCSCELNRMRAVKSESELGDIRRACDIASTAYYRGIAQVKKGMTERQLADIIESEMLALGAQQPSFETIVAFGENAAVPHHETGKTRLADDKVILVDMGALFNGYCSDLTRTAFYGEPSQKFLSAYAAVLNANLSAEREITAGMTGSQADKIARDLLTAAGYGQYFTHSLGHGVGLEIHEYPYLSPKRDNLLEEGNVFTVEPGVYIDGEFGIRIEDTVVMRGGKVERLFDDDKSLKIIKRQ